MLVIRCCHNSSSLRAPLVLSFQWKSNSVISQRERQWLSCHCLPVNLRVVWHFVIAVAGLTYATYRQENKVRRIYLYGTVYNLYHWWWWDFKMLTIIEKGGRRGTAKSQLNQILTNKEKKKVSLMLTSLTMGEGEIGHMLTIIDKERRRVRQLLIITNCQNS